jgi:glycosyltransferase involved in cell wall biosynthesis
MKIISIGSYKRTTNNHKAQFELLIGLKKRGVDLTVVADFSEEIRSEFNKENVRIVADSPKSKVDFDYIQRTRDYIVENGFHIVHVFNGKVTRNVILATKGLPVKVIAYMGSTSLHWHDPSSYLTYLSARNDKAVRIYKGYDPNWFEDALPFDYTKLGIDSAAIVVCMAANNRRVKGVKYFVKSSYFFKKSQQIHFVLMGNNCDKPAILSLIEKSPLKDNIHVLGSRKDAISLIKGADIYAQTSTSEGFGRAISEAMCVKKPIVMTDAGGCTELIDAQSGIIVKNKSPKAIAEGIFRLADDADLRLKMGENAYQRILKTYHVDKTVDETLALYEELYKTF